MAGALCRILEAEMTIEQMERLGGAARCAGATVKAEYAYAALLAVAQRDQGFQALPVAAQRRIDGSPVYKREMERAQAALEVLNKDATWVDLRHALQQLPPATLLHILDEEMDAEQMRKLAGKGRCGDAKRKGHLVYAVLLAVATRGSAAIKSLPINAQRRIEAAPQCADWLAELGAARHPPSPSADLSPPLPTPTPTATPISPLAPLRAERAGLRKDYEGDYRAFMHVLCDRAPLQEAPAPTSPQAEPATEQAKSRQAKGGTRGGAPRRLFDDEPADAAAAKAVPAGLSDAPGFWPSVYVGTFVLSLAIEPWVKALSPAIAAVGLLGAHAWFR
jgi:hypothetical protein